MDKSHANHSSFPHNREWSLIEKAWLNVAQERLDDILCNKVKTIPAEVVFERIDQLLDQ
ncbi:hypothetical protein INP78_12435 [Methylophilus sp. 14]|nr:hypothetical protein [Methylophilus sp. 14]